MTVAIHITATPVERGQKPITQVLEGKDSETVKFAAVQCFIELLNREDIIAISARKEVKRLL